MLRSIAARAAPVVFQQRGMATLKEIKTRLGSVTNIQKITKSMKMVATSKFKQAEKQLTAARVLGAANDTLSSVTGLSPEESSEKPIAVLITSDRGMCGGVHSAVSKSAKKMLETQDHELFILGDKAKAQLVGKYVDKFSLHVNEVGRLPPTFDEALFVAQEILKVKPNFQSGTIIYNRFQSAIAYNTVNEPIYGLETMKNSPEMVEYGADETDEDVVEFFHEFTLACKVYSAMKEGACSEQSARMTAMDNATNNSEDMIKALNLTYNRTRQAVITRELIEIISGASALE